jgi:lysyl-tRNA synthetase, class II
VWEIKHSGGSAILPEEETSSVSLYNFCDSLRSLFSLAITGTPCRTKRGELSLDASTLPIVLSPILASLPSTLEDPETRIRSRHADMLVNQRVAHTLRLRSHIIQHLRNFFLEDNFLEVQTPILADGAGGAIARPFVTSATEFQDKQLSLRIAPEIWLKRLVLGGMDRVFEIGPAFRNEGLDATHNPEFTTCEFYKSFANIEELIAMTEGLISGLALHVNTLIETQFTSLHALDLGQFTRPFKRIEFIPALEAAMGRVLPDLASEQAYQELVSLFFDLSIPLPSSHTLPRLLDRLSSRYLETQCTAPTFIIHPPACLAPLAKSFCDPSSNQLVSARAELFVQSHEVANMYEEENSPFEQREKFVQQAKWRDEENIAVTDENYLEALAWALPPTGGWGCGVERLCMLFSGSTRINDVLSFGNLRNVVGLGRGHKGSEII